MSKTRIFAILLWPVIGLLAYMLYNSVNSKIEMAQAIEKSEAKVVEKLKMVREAEKAFLIVNGYYTSNWDSLISFVKAGELPIVEKVEKVTPRKRDDPKYHEGDIIEIRFDTIGREPVMKKIFPAEKYPNFNADELPFIPGTEQQKFEVNVGKIDKGNGLVDVIEVVDRFPLDKTRSDKHPSRTRWHLRFGSMDEARTNGNWMGVQE
jgi:hypothetical protein